MPGVYHLHGGEYGVFSPNSELCADRLRMYSWYWRIEFENTLASPEAELHTLTYLSLRCWDFLKCQ